MTRRQVPVMIYQYVALRPFNTPREGDIGQQNEPFTFTFTFPSPTAFHPLETGLGGSWSHKTNSPAVPCFSPDQSPPAAASYPGLDACFPRKFNHNQKLDPIVILTPIIGSRLGTRDRHTRKCYPCLLGSTRTSVRISGLRHPFNPSVR